ncbi:MAG: serine--tRNA ligase, partial [Magnetococcales bacterium]|nr:serine--tRNA ligase [Magnetococcales bacterium]
MLDIKQIRKDPGAVRERLALRGETERLDQLLAIEEQKRAMQTETETGQARRNEISKEIGRRKSQGEDASDLFAEMKTLGPRLKQLASELKEKEQAVGELLATLPNTPHQSVPIGANENENVEIRRWSPVGGDGADAPALDFEAKNHWDVGTDLGILDFEAGAKLAGARFTVFRGAGARLSRALINFMLDLHTEEHSYTEIQPPMLANAKTLYGTGQLPKFEEDLFAMRDDAYYLIPTAEVPLTNLVADSIVEEADLPLRMTAWTACFRREAGAAGQDTRGLIRQHQFDKVELVWITKPEESAEALEKLTNHAEEVLRRLELPHRTISLCTGDLGFAAVKTYDLEVWLPGQGCYREISSCSNTEGFQAR